MILNQRDIPLLMAFLSREADDMRFGNASERSRFIDGKLAEIMQLLAPIKKGDYIKINSLTNLGQLARQLILTVPNEWWKNPTTTTCTPTMGCHFC